MSTTMRSFVVVLGSENPQNKIDEIENLGKKRHNLWTQNLLSLRQKWRDWHLFMGKIMKSVDVATFCFSSFAGVAELIWDNVVGGNCSRKLSSRFFHSSWENCAWKWAHWNRCHASIVKLEFEFGYGWQKRPEATHFFLFHYM